MKALSIIIPYVNEWPLNMFTIRAVAEDLIGRCDFEIIAVDNFCDEVESQGHEQDRSFGHLKAVSKAYPWLKVVRYDKKLSHWNAKNIAIDLAEGQTLLFIDAHCAISKNAIYDMWFCYVNNDLNGSLHLPLTYHIMEYHRLIYKPVIDIDNGLFHYSFTSYREPDDSKSPVFEVPVMSTCGMMIEKEFMQERLGCWPPEMGIYGGGENFINYTMAVLGMKKYIFRHGTLFHHGDKRGYHWNGDDYIRNRAIATYMFTSGTEMTEKYCMNCKGNPARLREIFESVVNNKLLNIHKNYIQEQIEIPVLSWVKKWQQ